MTHKIFSVCAGEDLLIFFIVFSLFSNSNSFQPKFQPTDLLRRCVVYVTKAIHVIYSLAIFANDVRVYAQSVVE